MALNPGGLPAQQRRRRQNGRAIVSTVEVWLVFLGKERGRRGHREGGGGWEGRQRRLPDTHRAWEQREVRRGNGI